MTESDPSAINIRASGLATATDCRRRWALSTALDPKSNFMPVLNKHGFEFPVREKQNIGATIGQACHEGMGLFFQAKIDGYQGGADGCPAGNPIYVAKTKFKKLTASGMPTDRESPTATAAETQIERALKAYLPFAETLKPQRVEFELKAKVDPLKPYEVTGHPDIKETDHSIRDMKFGKNLSSYEPQLGAYRIMERSKDMPTGKLFIDWVKRVSVNSPQPALQVIEYDAHIAETAAHRIIEESVYQMEKFTETGDVWSFPANPNSKLCSKRWCPAHSTPFCDMGRPGKDDAD